MKKVFTKNDEIPPRIEIRAAIPDFERPELKMKDCCVVTQYNLVGTEQGLEGVVFASYEKIETGIRV